MWHHNYLFYNLPLIFPSAYFYIIFKFTYQIFNMLDIYVKCYED